MNKQEQGDVIEKHLKQFKAWRKTDKIEQRFVYITPAEEQKQLEKIATFPIECIVFQNNKNTKLKK